MTEYETQRAEKIRRNKLLLQELQLPIVKNEPPAKRQKTKHRSTAPPTRTSARIAATERQPVYHHQQQEGGGGGGGRKARPRTAPHHRSVANKAARAGLPDGPSPRDSALDLARLRARWTSWEPAAGPPTRDADGSFRFASHPGFTPNKSPEECLREGAFGGAYFGPVRSAVLRATVAGDWRELPERWVEGLDVGRCVAGAEYDAEVNKYGVACGQSIEQWEANGWINHEYDVRGWFQWYCRFFQGRRCPDDERQVSRWRRCAGDTGRWRRALLKKYVLAGIRTVTDEGDDNIEGVSPAIHQTLHHWAFELRQGVLDQYWDSNH